MFTDDFDFAAFVVVCAKQRLLTIRVEHITNDRFIAFTLIQVQPHWYPAISRSIWLLPILHRYKQLG
jgi:hypothetical protein